MADTSWPRTPVKDQPLWQLWWQDPGGHWREAESEPKPLRAIISAARLMRDAFPGVETQVRIAK